MSCRADILEIARVLSEAARCRDIARFQPPAAIGKDAAVYALAIQRLRVDQDIPEELRPAHVRPFFLINGLLLATSLPGKPLAALFEALATGLLEFADYFELISDRFEGKAPPLSDEQAEAAEKRYFAYCLAQLTECGMPLTGVFATMKGDSLAQSTAYEVRAWIEEGPQRMLRSELLTPAERALWKDLFDRGQQAWPALRDHLVATHSLPLRRIPGR